MKVRLESGLRVEDLGDEAVVLDPAGTSVYRVEGDALRVLRLLTAVGGDGPVDVPDELRSGVDDLIEAGVVETPPHWRRRKFLAAGGATWTAATVVAFGLADPAAASTRCPGGITPTAGAPKYTASGTFTTGPAGFGTTTYSPLVSAAGPLERATAKADWATTSRAILAATRPSAPCWSPRAEVAANRVAPMPVPVAALVASVAPVAPVAPGTTVAPAEWGAPATGPVARTTATVAVVAVVPVAAALATPAVTACTAARTAVPVAAALARPAAARAARAALTRTGSRPG